MRKVILVTVALALLVISSVNAHQEDQKLFQMALSMEREEGNLAEAIRLYQRVIQETEDEVLAAKAQLMIGICHEKLGNTEAQKAYELVIEKYPHQTAQVAAARTRMADLMAKMQSEPFLSHLYSKNDDGFYFEAQSLSPDGTKIVGIDFATGQNVVYKDLTTGKLVNITNFEWSNPEHGYTYDPVWSPDGKEIVFDFCGFADEVWEIRVADLEGVSRTIYRNESDEAGTIYPCDWFPEGDAILAIHITKANEVQLGVIPIEGGEFESIYEPDLPLDANFIPTAWAYFQVDLSPDGTHVVFDKAEGDIKKLYVLDIETKKAHGLFDTPASDSQPFWSPDGKHIAFLSDRAGSKTLWAVSVDESGSPEGKPVLMRDSMEHAKLGNWNAQGITYSNLVSMRDIYTMPVDPRTGAPAGKPQQLDFRPTGFNFYPAYSPDGTSLAFVSKPQEEPPLRNVHIVPVSGGEGRSFRIPSKNHWAAPQDFAWLPDGSGVSFTGETSSETPGWEDGSVPFRFFRLQIDTGMWQTYALQGEKWGRAEWRGDGQAFYYVHVSPDHQTVEISERDLQTGTDRVITEEGGPLLKCSRDYKTFATNSDGKIKIVDPQTGEILKELDNLGLPPLGRPSWSPDGENLLSWGPQKNSYNVISCADGTSQNFDISESLPEGTAGAFDWSPQGDQVAFTFRFLKVDTYLISNLIPEDKK
ncbi:MAG: tetratricopeptide repeat protein [Gemmatimonadales bacterium]|nr:tetratricopeptide repeat protein [Gemmatimonadales bacterium]